MIFCVALPSITKLSETGKWGKVLVGISRSDTEKSDRRQNDDMPG
jgi:hypothetical protein